MKTILAPRASAILYNLLRSREDRRPFLLPANICPVVPLTFFKAEIPCEFIDIAPASLNMDLDQAEERLRLQAGRCGGILYAHTYGESSTPFSFFDLVKRKWSDLLMIDDRCLCIPDLEPWQDSQADVVLYSTGYAKIVDMGVCGFAHLKDELEYQHHSLSYDPAALTAVEADYKAHINEGSALAYGDSEWLQTDAELPTWTEYAGRLRAELGQSLAHRDTINAVYNSLIPADLQLRAEYQQWRFNLCLDHRDAVLKAIFDAGLFASAHYRSLAGIMGKGTDTVARRLAAEVLNLFNDRHFTIDMAERTAKIVLQSI